MKKILKMNGKCIRLNLDSLDKNKADILYDIFYNNKIIKLKIDNFNKNEQISLINLFLNCNNNKSISSFILYLYDKIIQNKIETKMSEKELTFVQNKNLYNSLYIFSNVLFSDL